MIALCARASADAATDDDPCVRALVARYEDLAVDLVSTPSTGEPRTDVEPDDLRDVDAHPDKPDDERPDAHRDIEPDDPRDLDAHRDTEPDDARPDVEPTDARPDGEPDDSRHEVDDRLDELDTCGSDLVVRDLDASELVDPMDAEDREMLAMDRSDELDGPRDDADEPRADRPAPSRVGRLDIGFAWRRTLTQPRTGSPKLDDQLWLVATWSR